MRLCAVSAIFFVLCAVVRCEGPFDMWDMESLSIAPAVHAAPGIESEGVKALFYDALPWKGRPTRVFAWYGAPQGAEQQKFPAMVLVHGGGGTAFAGWVRLWNKRGYAAVAMDVCGAVPGAGRHDFSGPPGWGGFNQLDWPLTDQWTYHAVADIVLAHSLLRSFPEVDAGRIGLTGNSWGGYLACIVSALDQRFKFAAPVYGCGYYDQGCSFGGILSNLPAAQSELWMKTWDPSVYLAHTRMPMLWVNGVNDYHYPPGPWQRSYRLPPGPRVISLKLSLPHGDGDLVNPPETLAMAGHFLCHGKPLPRVVSQGRDFELVWAVIKAETPLAKAELLYTKDFGPWRDRAWKSVPAERDETETKFSAELPDGVSACFMNFTDANGVTVSTEHEVLADAPAAPVPSAAVQ